jgi:hypothetical protein
MAESAVDPPDRLRLATKVVKDGSFPRALDHTETRDLVEMDEVTMQHPLRFRGRDQQGGHGVD